MTQRVGLPASVLQVPEPHEYRWTIVCYYHSGRKAFTIGCTNDNAKDFELERLSQRTDLGKIEAIRGERNKGH